jgi:DNA-binding MarR family transcriptional regulator
MPMMAKEIAEAMNVSRANVTNLLNILIKKILIVQMEDSSDARRKRLLLTKPREKLVNLIEKARECYNKKLFAVISNDSKKGVNDFIDTCLGIMGNGSLLTK